MTENLFQKINSDLIKAMKEKNSERLNVLRMVKSKILMVNARGDLKEDEIIKIVSKYAKSVKETIEETKKVGRDDAAKEAEKELKIVEEYLPKQLSEDEVKTAVKTAIETSGASGMKDMGKVMKEVLAQHAGIDGKLVSKLVRELLA